MIVGVPDVPLPVTNADDPRLANFRDLTAGDPTPEPPSVRQIDADGQDDVAQPLFASLPARVVRMVMALVRDALTHGAGRAAPVGARY
jgi:hypothetical protein